MAKKKFNLDDVDSLKRNKDVQGLIEALECGRYEYKREKVREAAAKALGELDASEAIDNLIPALRDYDTSVGNAAAEALVHIGGATVIEKLIEQLKFREGVEDFNPASVARVLGELGDTRAVPQLIRELKSIDCAEWASHALGEIRDPRSVEPLIKACLSSSPLIEFVSPMTAGLALRKIGDPSAVKILATYLVHKNGLIRMRVAEVLGYLGDSAVLQSLIDALHDGDAFVRCAAAKALGEIGNSRAMLALEETLKDDNSDVRQAATESLGKLRHGKE